MRLIYKLFSGLIYHVANIATNNRFQIGDISLPAGKNHIYAHVASLGEWKSISPLIKSIKQSYQNVYVSVSVTSGSAYDVFFNESMIDFVFRFPFDHEYSLKRFIHGSDVKLLIVAEQEYWFNLYRISKIQSIPVFMVGTKLYKEHVWFNKKLGFWSKYLSYAHIYAKSITDKELLVENGYSVQGIVGYLRLKQALEEKCKMNHLLPTSGAKYTILCASIHRSDLGVLTDAIKKTSTYMRWVLVPHHVQESLSEFFGKDFYTFIKDEENVMIVNELGKLNQMYPMADMTYVGGGFGSGIHNVLEPAVYNRKILVGPNNKSFSEVKILKECGQLEEIQSGQELSNLVMKQTKKTFECYNDLWDDEAFQELVDSILGIIKT